jgi:tRNA(fMet)-specific endonuclease VapC
MTLRILDTDHVSFLQRGYPQVKQRFDASQEADLAITIITAEEQIRGRFKVIRDAQQERGHLVSAYNLFLANLEFLKQFTILPFEQAAWDIYRQLIDQKVRVGSQDLKITTIALTRNAILVTRNQRDFSRVPGLVLEDWTL